MGPRVIKVNSLEEMGELFEALFKQSQPTEEESEREALPFAKLIQPEVIKGLIAVDKPCDCGNPECKGVNPIDVTDWVLSLHPAYADELLSRVDQKITPDFLLLEPSQRHAKLVALFAEETEKFFN